MDRQDTQSPDWSSMSDDELAFREADYRQQVAYGNNNGCREYLTAAVIERCMRDLAAVRDLASKWGKA